MRESVRGGGGGGFDRWFGLPDPLLSCEGRERTPTNCCCYYY